MSNFATEMGCYTIPGYSDDRCEMTMKASAMYDAMNQFEFMVCDANESMMPPTQDELERIAIGWIDYQAESQLVSNLFADYIMDKLEEIRSEA